MRDLEDEIGAALIHRNARGVKPTLAGDSLYFDAVRILRLADNLGGEAQRAVRGTSGRVHAVIVRSAMVWEIMARASADCGARVPDVDITVEDVPTPRQGLALRNAST